jgi:replicative DNA helicase
MKRSAAPRKVEDPKAKVQPKKIPPKPPLLTSKVPTKASTKGEIVKITHDAVNEQVLIAAAIVDHPMRRKLLGMVKPDALFAKGHPEIWTVIGELESRGLGYDPATVRQLSNGAVDTEYLDDLIRQRPALPPNLMHHVDCLQWDRARVEATRGPIASLLDCLRDPTSDQERVRSLARQVAQCFDGYGSTKYLRDPVQLVAEQMAIIRARREGIACYPFGLPGFDHYTSGPKEGEWRVLPGLAPKMVTLITGLSGSGKTTVTAQIALAQINAGRKVLYGAWEQGDGMTLELLASISLGLSRSRLTSGSITDEEETMLREEMDRITGLVRFFAMPFGRVKGEKQQNDKNLDLIHQYVAESGCEIFIADLWRYALRQYEPDEEEHALKRQKAIAVETNTHHILIHQLRGKELENRPDKRPTREGIKGTGAWIEVPDNILGVHRPALWKNVDDVILESILLKQRHGIWPLAVEFDWDPDLGTITNGRGVDYARPGEETSMDDFLDETRTRKRPRKGKAS